MNTFPTLRASGTSLLHSLGATLLLSIIGGCLSSPVRAETTSGSGATLISSSGGAQVNISTPGTYYLNADVNVTITSGVFLDVTASNVTIDLNGHTITCTASAGAANRTNCVYATDKSNITVRNGNINGFWMGVVLLPSSSATIDTTCLSYGHLVEDVCFTKSVYSGVQLYGVGCRIHRCRTVLNGNASSTASQSVSFLNEGLYNTVEDCDVMGSQGSVPSYGIIIGIPGNCFAVNNRISGVSYGLYCKEASDKYRDNLTAGITTTAYYSSGTDTGNNN